MERRRKVQTAIFEVKDPTGRSYTVVETTLQISVTFLADTTPGAWTNASRSYSLRGGGPVNRISDTEFEILSTDEIATLV